MGGSSSPVPSDRSRRGRMRMPPARGALSSWLAATLRRSPSAIPAAVSAPPVPGGNSAAWEDEDLQLALWCCYELHYRGFEDVDEDWEWHPAVLAFRGSLERQWLTSLHDLAGEHEAVPAVPAVTLAVSNLMSLFALHRRWTGALLGHLAALEMTSTGPNRLYSAGARRLGASAQQRRRPTIPPPRPTSCSARRAPGTCCPAGRPASRHRGLRPSLSAPPDTGAGRILRRAAPATSCRDSRPGSAPLLVSSGHRRERGNLSACESRRRTA
jgi:hypothetical protein